MKIKKIVSLMLVLAMVVSVFSTLTVAAAGTANLGFTIYEADGTTEVNGNLEVGKIYYASIALSDISAKKVKTAQITANYNTDVIDLVNENGEVATDYDVVIERTDIYDPKYNKTGVFEVMELKTANGMIDYTISIAKEMDASLKETGVDCDGTYEIIKVRFKTKKNGQIGFGIATSELGEGNYNPSNANGVIFTNPDAVEVTTIASTARVGEVAYVDAEVDEAFVAAEKYVLGETTKDAVLADLAAKYAKVKVTFTDEESVASDPVDCAITWKAADNFDASKADTYTFTGAVDTTAVNYTGDAVQVTATVTVEPLTVEAITAFDNVVVRQNNADDIAGLLPAEVEVTVTGGKKAMLPATWSPDAVNNTATGTTTYTATITGTADITVEDKNTVSFDVTVIDVATNTAPTAEQIEEEVHNADIDADKIESVLPKFIVVKEDGYISVDRWEIKEVDGVAVEEGYVPAIGDVITYAPVFAEGFTAPANFVATVTVVVPDGKKELTFTVKTETEVTSKTDANYTIEDAKKAAGFVGKIGEYKDATAIDASAIVWETATVPEYDNAVAGEYVLTGTWADIYGNSESFEITIVIEQAGATDFKFMKNAQGKNELKSPLALDTNDTMMVYVSFVPSDADDEIVEWKTSNNTRATVERASDKSARIKTKSAVGKVTITAVSKSNITKSFEIIVEGTNVNGGYYYQSGNGSGSSILSQTVEQVAGQEAAQNSVFGDLAGYEWAATQIDTLRLLGIVSGKSATSYAPADSVTRAEYLAMLVRLLNLQANGEAKTFTDVNPGDWFYDVVNVASSLGIAYGYENGAFDPNAVIKRQDMAVFAKRAMDAAGIPALVGISSTFEDQADIDAYALDAVLYMSSVGVINGMGDGTFKPLETANRAQAAVVIYNIYTIKNK